MLNNLLNDYNVIIKENNNNPISAHILNKYPIYIINLKSDIIRRNYIKHLFERNRINYKLILVNKFTYKKNTPKCNIDTPRLGCILSHLWCINNAITNNFQHFIIFEDDIIFHKNFSNIFSNIINDINFKNIDLLMLGALDCHYKTNISTLKNNVYYPKQNILGAHSNLYSLNFAKDFLNYKLNSSKILEFDIEYYHFFSKFTIAVCEPNIVICELSSTNLNHKLSPFSESGFKRYISLFPATFSYNNYEYITINFIDYINRHYKNHNYTNFENMIELFSDDIKHKNNAHINDIKEWLLNGGYTVDIIMQIISNIYVDKL